MPVYLCNICKKEKPLEQMCKGSMKSRCKKCHALYVYKKSHTPEGKLKIRETYLKWYESHRDFAIKRSKKWREDNLERHRNYYRQYQKDRRATNPLQRLKEGARARLSYRIKKGQIKRLPCEKCGAVKTEGHHFDYSKPYDVNWFCVFHHNKLHFGR